MRLTYGGSTTRHSTLGRQSGISLAIQ